MAVSSQTTLSNAFCWMKMCEFLLISLKYVPWSRIDNNPALVLIMAWHRTGDKPLTEPMIVSLLTHTVYALLGLNELMDWWYQEPGHHQAWYWPLSFSLQMPGIDNILKNLVVQSPTWRQISCCPPLTHWGRVTHICVSKLTIIGSDNGLSPGRRQAIIWTNAGILLIRPLGTNFNEMLIEILTFSFMKMRLKVSSAKWRPFCLGLNVLNISCPSNCSSKKSNKNTWVFFFLSWLDWRSCCSP